MGVIRRALVMALAGATALTVAGCGPTAARFTVEVPPTWNDRTATAERQTGQEYVVLFAGPGSEDLIPTIEVVRGTPPEGVTLDQATRENVQGIRKVYGTSTPVTPAEPTKIHGAPAERFDFRRGGRTARRVIALRDGELFLVTLVSSTPAFARNARALDRMLDSWRWN